MEKENRILTRNWDLYDTRNVVYKTKSLNAEELKTGYDRAYHEFYSWNNIFNASLIHPELKHKLKHFAYTAGWKKFEPFWNLIIKTQGLNHLLPLLELILSKVQKESTQKEKLWKPNFKPESILPELNSPILNQ